MNLLAFRFWLVLNEFSFIWGVRSFCTAHNERQSISTHFITTINQNLCSTRIDQNFQEVERMLREFLWWSMKRWKQKKFTLFHTSMGTFKERKKEKWIVWSQLQCRIWYGWCSRRKCVCVYVLIFLHHQTWLKIIYVHLPSILTLYTSFLLHRKMIEKWWTHIPGTCLVKVIVGVLVQVNGI